MRPHLAILLCAFFWATTFVAVKIAMVVVPVAEVVAVRFGLGALVVWAVVLATRPRLGLIRVGWRAFATGLFEPGLISVMIFWGLLWTTAIHATVIFSLMPLVASLFGRIFLAERIAAPVVTGSIVAIAGTVLLVSTTSLESGASLFGDVVVMFGVVLITGGQIVLRRVALDFGQPLVVTAFLLTGAAASGLAVAAASASTPGVFSWMVDAKSEIWAALVYLAVFVSAVTFLLYNYALRHVAVGRTSLYVTLVTPLGVFLAVVILGESVSVTDVIAIALVVVGVAIPALARVRPATLWRRFANGRRIAPRRAPRQHSDAAEPRRRDQH